MVQHDPPAGCAAAGEGCSRRWIASRAAALAHSFPQVSMPRLSCVFPRGVGAPTPATRYSDDPMRLPFEACLFTLARWSSSALVRGELENNLFQCRSQARALLLGGRRTNSKHDGHACGVLSGRRDAKGRTHEGPRCAGAAARVVRPLLIQDCGLAGVDLAAMPPRLSFRISARRARFYDRYVSASKGPGRLDKGVGKKGKS